MKKLLFLFVGITTLSLVSCRQDNVLSEEDSANLKILQNPKTTTNKIASDSLVSLKAYGDPLRPPK